MNPKTKNMYFGVIALAFFTLIVGVYAAVPTGAPQDSIVTYDNDTSIRRADYFVVDRDIFYRTHNVTEAISSLLGINATNEWGVVIGTTGDWFNYTDISANPVYIGLQMHPLNLTIGGEYVIPNVYDKDATHWQLELVWMGNSTQCNKDCLVMYYAHVEWSNTDDTPIKPNDEGEPL